MRKATVRQFTEKRKTVETTCDLCGGPTEGGVGWERNVVTIEARIGEIYPEGDMREQQETDVCADCWPKVRSALEAIGCKFRTFDVESMGDDRYDSVEEA